MLVHHSSPRCVHSNGSSLVRKVFDVENRNLTIPVDELGGKSIGETLLTPTKIYVKPVLALLEKIKIKGISYITGGGFYENILRSILDSLGAKIDRSAVKVCRYLISSQRREISASAICSNTFNMGVGMSIVVSKDDADEALSILKASGEEPYIIGEIVSVCGENRDMLKLSEFCLRRCVDFHRRLCISRL